MEVVCEKCTTEYEFDDALVSERGTTVKCTNCGHKFKVRSPSLQPGAAPERWLVRTADGHDLDFPALRDLQAAIAQGKVTPSDQLSRGTSPPRKLGSIVELAPFFDAAGGRVSSVPPPAVGKGSPEGRSNTLIPPTFSAPKPMQPQPGVAAPASTLPGVPPAPKRPPEVERLLAEAAKHSSAPPPLPPRPLSKPPSSPPQPPSEPPGRDSFAPTPGPTQMTTIPPAPSVPPSGYPSSPPSSLPRGSIHNEPSFRDSRISLPVPKRRLGSVAALLSLLGIGAAGVWWFVTQAPHSATNVEPTAAPVATVDTSRLQKLTSQASAALLEGDLELAKEATDKATVLSEDSIEVLDLQAAIAIERAERTWLRGRIAMPGTTEATVIEKELVPQLARAEAAASARKSKGGGEATLAEAEVLRLRGKLTEAKALLASVEGMPRAAVASAALSLADDQTDAAARVAILRKLSDSSMRAKALLAYALALAGMQDEATALIATLKAGAAPHPLVAPLTDYIARTSAKAPPAATASASAEPAQAIPATDVDLVRMGYEARAAGDLRRAEQLFSQALAKNPDNRDAKTGLDDTLAARVNEPRKPKTQPKSGGGKPSPDGRVPDDYVWTPPDATQQPPPTPSDL